MSAVAGVANCLVSLDFVSLVSVFQSCTGTRASVNEASVVVKYIIVGWAVVAHALYSQYSGGRGRDVL